MCKTQIWIEVHEYCWIGNTIFLVMDIIEFDEKIKMYWSPISKDENKKEVKQLSHNFKTHILSNLPKTTTILWRFINIKSFLFVCMEVNFLPLLVMFFRQIHYKHFLHLAALTFFRHWRPQKTLVKMFE